MPLIHACYNNDKYQFRETFVTSVTRCRVPVERGTAVDVVGGVGLHKNDTFA